MTRQSVFRYHFTSANSKHCSDWQRLTDNDFHDLPKHMQLLTAIADPERVWAEDFLRVAKAAYLADRRSLRRLMPDGWTRTIELSVQVVAPDRWGEQQKADLSSLLETLTGDLWKIHVQGAAPTQHTLQDSPWATKVALFSGGLDSTAYAAHLATQLRAQENVAFIAYDWNLQNPQQWIFNKIRNLASARIRLSQIRLRPRTSSRALDATNRSRSLLFVATALCVAAVHRVTRVAVPENGQLALNPPLTPGRLSSCSTRSVHPWTLHLINKIIAGIGGDITVYNPFLGLTKGDVCKRAHNAGLSLDVLHKTVSCGRPTTARARGNPDYHCGHCFPCLVRRAGMHALLDGQPDQSGYKVEMANIDPFSQDDPHAIDLRDVIYWLSRDFTTADLIADMPLPPQEKPDKLMPVLERGRTELADMISNLVPVNNRFHTSRPAR